MAKTTRRTFVRRTRTGLGAVRRVDVEHDDGSTVTHLSGDVDAMLAEVRDDLDGRAREKWPDEMAELDDDDGSFIHPWIFGKD